MRTRISPWPLPICGGTTGVRLGCGSPGPPGCFNLGLCLTLEWFWAAMAVTFVYGAVVVVATIGIEFRVRRAQERLTADSGKDFYVDEDDQWIWGMFYYNPNDKRLVVNNRTGINTTFNLARRGPRSLWALRC